jgi:hypothetical protein
MGRPRRPFRDRASTLSSCVDRTYPRTIGSLTAEAFGNQKGRRLSKQSSAPKLKKGSKAKPATRVQYGALPYRLDDNASVEVLLVTSRETKRWIIPKGWPIKG